MLLVILSVVDGNKSIISFSVVDSFKSSVAGVLYGMSKFGCVILGISEDGLFEVISDSVRCISGLL